MNGPLVLKLGGELIERQGDDVRKHQKRRGHQSARPASRARNKVSRAYSLGSVLRTLVR